MSAAASWIASTRLAPEADVSGGAGERMTEVVNMAGDCPGLNVRLLSDRVVASLSSESGSRTASDRSGRASLGRLYVMPAVHASDPPTTKESRGERY